MQSFAHHVGPTIVRVFSDSIQQPYAGQRTAKRHRRGLARRLTRR